MYIYMGQNCCGPIGFKKNKKSIKSILTKAAVFCIVQTITDAILAQLARARDL